MTMYNMIRIKIVIKECRASDGNDRIMVLPVIMFMIMR